MRQFGTACDGLVYRERPTAFGVLVHQGRLACVRIERGANSYFDLPGGAREAGESEQQALMREFREETGLGIEPDIRLGEAAQYRLKRDGQAVNNQGGFWRVRLVDPTPSGQVETDHELVWMDTALALLSLRHEAHAWAVGLCMARRKPA